MLTLFEEEHLREDCVSNETFSFLRDLIANPSREKLDMVEQPEDFKNYFEKYHAFKSEVLKGSHGKTAQFWARYMEIIQMVLTLIRATKENNLKLHIAALYA